MSMFLAQPDLIEITKASQNHSTDPKTFSDLDLHAALVWLSNEMKHVQGAMAVDWYD